MPKDNEYCACLWVILLDFVVKTNNNYDPEIFLAEWKYAAKNKNKKKMNTNNEELELRESDDGYDEYLFKY